MEEKRVFTKWLHEVIHKQQNEKDLLGVHKHLIRKGLLEKDASDVVKEVIYCMMDEYGD